MNTVRWGVVGAGDVCERKSGPPLYQVDRSEVVLVHRRDRAAGEDFARRHAGRYVSQLDELLDSDEIDAVYVATPHALHAEQTVAALEAGKHVLVEKPMALSAVDCGAMIDAARSAGRALGVAYYRRGYPSIQRIRELVDTGAVGAVESMQLNNEFPTSHRIDLVHYLLGPIEAVRMTAPVGTGYVFELLSPRIEAKTASGVEVSMGQVWTETGMPESLVLQCEGGSVHLIDLKGGSLIIMHGAGKPEGQIEQLGGLRYTHWGLIENFVSHLIDGSPLLCDGVEGRKSTVILDALAGARKGEWSEVRY